MRRRVPPPKGRRRADPEPRVFKKERKMAKKRLFEYNHIKSSSLSEIQVYNAGYEKTTGKKAPRVLTDFGGYSMHYVFSGSGVVELDGKAYKVHKDEIFFLFPDVKTAYYPDKKTPWRYSWIDFFGTKAAETLAAVRVDLDHPILKINDSEIGKLFMKNVSECNKYVEVSDWISVSYFYKIMAQIAVQNGGETETKAAPSHTNLIEQALGVIEKNYRDPEFNLKLLAYQIGVSSEYLSRLFAAHLGTTFTNYLRKKRIAKAVELFDKGNYTIKEVADMTGFSDPYYFSTVFKKLNLVSPRQHLKNIGKLQ